MELPEALAAAVAADPRRREWAAALPGVVDALSARWSITPGPPFRPGGHTAWVAPAGPDLVVKVGWRHPEDEHEADGLRAWAGAGAVAVHATWRDATTSALLLERCRPGTPLGPLRDGPQRDVVVAGLLRRLWRPAGPPFRPLAELCDLWADGAERDPPPLDPGLRRAGLELLRGLPRTSDERFLLATDLHAGNVLAHGDGWRLVDPKPYAGDRCYDLLQHLLNEPERFSADPRGLPRRLAGLTGLDPDRVLLWAFARTVVQARWTPWARSVASVLAP